ncbi:cryptochrome DASH [Cucurbitaria berberidis CBS 394.84]|uniref:Cryptochrome DASH n=1 Tax=Cucurbitaria berberidis CBS 394.84 TaxID=1168544 RepID=A0A9P4LEW3_9PLEO|nr:cryptochrome DASH [Cucurbitaria berberidis CBS 394.84]KAF1851782.1 cryptochrome DASH [Cucurbitaria berberidis CBS 394.84]
MSKDHPRILLYILRRDIRLSDNPIFHFASHRTKQTKSSRSPSNSDKRNRDDSLTSEHGDANFTHVLPIYIFSANQIEVSGFLSSPSDQCPYAEARSAVAGVWRTGPHRAKFIAEGVWDLKRRLESLECGSGLEIRVGRVGDVVSDILDWYSKNCDNGDNKAEITGICMTGDDGTEEKDDENIVKDIAEKHNVDFEVWEDEKFYVDDRDLPYENISELPNVYTTYRKSLEPLRDRPRNPLPTPTQLPPLPPVVPPQTGPFTVPTNFNELKKRLLAPLEKDPTFTLTHPPQWPTDVKSAHPFDGGETVGRDRIAHLIRSGAMSSYKATRNGMLGLDFSTKLSAFLAQGHITARQVHWAMVDFEEGRGDGKDLAGYGKGENEGTAAVRFELLWRDYMRLCMQKFGHRMFSLYGIQDKRGKDDQQNCRKPWRTLHKTKRAGEDPEKALEIFMRFRSGRTGVGLIDASNRELFVTGYTSNRARQNVASFLSSHLNIDWRVGAEWYECFLTDYDTASNWGNWQYVAGVGNDPRQGRIFNPVKQALDYDPQGDYIKAWVPELRGIKLTRTIGPGREEVDQQRLMYLYQVWKLSDWEKTNLGLKGLEWVEQPLTKIQFSVGRARGGHGDGKSKRGGGGGGSWRGRGRGQERNFRRMGNEDRVARSEEGPTIVSSERV